MTPSDFLGQHVRGGDRERSARIADGHWGGRIVPRCRLTDVNCRSLPGSPSSANRAGSSTARLKEGDAEPLDGAASPSDHRGMGKVRCRAVFAPEIAEDGARPVSGAARSSNTPRACGRRRGRRSLGSMSTRASSITHGRVAVRVAETD
jgi:hypothetical protein